MSNLIETIKKILFQHELFNHLGFLISIGDNAIEHKKMLRAIELFWTKVTPAIWEEITWRNA